MRARGVVQGVGFRPHVYRLAGELGLAGFVGNDAEGVFIEVEGPRCALDEFVRRVEHEAPPLARVDSIEWTAIDATRELGFRIVESEAGTAARTFVSPDVAVCDECLRDLADPADRRYRYPFVNCTNCGPRFTITMRLPYDRPNTTMRDFAMCGACAAEYHDPADRRFHAQPIACPACGPSLWFEEPGRRVSGTDAALTAAQRALARGAIVAVKGLGGYHLACDARSHHAVSRLRARKHRPDKPFAVMVPDLATAATIALLDEAERRVLTSPQRPIVLAARREGSGVAAPVAPGNPLIGVLLPYTPLHHLLFAPVPRGHAPVFDVLVMTSGNLSDEPICYDDGDASRRLEEIVDAWLVHDRPIHVPCDDSVVRVVDGRELPLRRSRGATPLPVRLPFDAPPALAVGGELKNTFCLGGGTDAWLSQHIGDMGSLETLAAFERSTSQFSAMYSVEPTVVVADAHPGYLTRGWAERRGLPVVLVQHHHAHIAAVMAEHGLGRDERVIGFAFDGTGYGSDGRIWGGEVLVAGYGEFDRARHLRTIPLPGGDAAIRKPYRVALSHLRAAGVGWTADLPPVRAASADERTVLVRQLDRGVHCVPTSSMGRLFDAVSSLLDIRHVVSYEAQAAIELETIAAEHVGRAPVYRFGREGSWIDAGPVVRDLVAGRRAGIGTGELAAGFHLAVARLVGEIARELRDETGLERVALSGGVFQNVLLLRLVEAELAPLGVEVLTHRKVPPNDGGLALGQLAIAARKGASR